MARIAEQPLGVGVGAGGARGKPAGQRLRFFLEPVRRDDAVHDAEPFGLARAEAIAEERKLHRLLGAHRARQKPGRRAVRARADAAIGHGEDAVRGADREVGGENQAQSEAAGGAADAGDDRLRHPPHDPDDAVDHIDEPLEVLPAFIRRELDQLVEGAQVAARHEVPARAAQHQHAGLGIALQRGQGREKRLAELGIEGIQHLRSVEGHSGDAILSLDLHGVAHVVCLLLPQGAS